MKTNKNFLSSSFVLFLIGLGVFMPVRADAFGQQVGNFDFQLTGYGMAGLIEPDFNEPKFLGDFKVRAQAAYDFNREHKLGLSYTYDENALDEHEWAHDMFGFWQWRDMGRMEIGFTDSVAHKLSLGLPDVGGLRINENSLIYRKIGADGPVVADTVITSGHDALRLNIVSAGGQHSQYGVSVSGLTGDYDFGVAAGLKLKYSEAKTKMALSLGADFIDNPDGYEAHGGIPVYADWRAQVGAGINVQYNSLVFGVNARAIYDENPTGIVSDGLSAGAGVSYDILNYSLSVSYILSDTGIWHSEVPEYVDNTVVGSVRCKYSRYVDFWASVGLTRHEPFAAAAIRLNF